MPSPARQAAHAEVRRVALGIDERVPEWLRNNLRQAQRQLRSESEPR